MGSCRTTATNARSVAFTIGSRKLGQGDRVQALRVAFGAFLLAAVMGALVAAWLPFYTRGEPREAIAVRAMAEGHGLLLPERRDDGPPRKPPMFHWLAAGLTAAGVRPAELAVRLPNILLGAAAVGVAAGTTTVLHGPAAGVLAGVLLGTTFEWFRAATRGRVDMTLTAFLSLATLALWVGLQRGARRWLWLAGVAGAAATLAKGPVGVVLPVGIVIVDALANGERARLRRLLDPVLVALALLPPGLWYFLASRHGTGLLRTQILEENVYRFFGIGYVPHIHSVFYYPPLLAAGLLPWTPAVLAGVWAAWRRRTRVDRFLLVWAGVVLGFFSLAAGKRSVYLLPSYPPLAVVGGVWLAQWCRVPATAALRRLATIGAAALVAASVAMSLAPIQEALQGRLAGLVGGSERALLAHAFAVLAGSGPAPVMVAIGFAAVLLAALLARRDALRVGAFGVLGIATALAPVLLGTMPLARRLSPRPFADQVARLVGPTAPLCVLGEVPDSLRFYLARPLPPCRFRCDAPTGSEWVVRAVAFDARQHEACLHRELRYDGSGRGDALRLDRIDPRPQAEKDGDGATQRRADAR